MTTAAVAQKPPRKKAGVSSNKSSAPSLPSPGSASSTAASHRTVSCVSTVLAVVLAIAVGGFTGQTCSQHVQEVVFSITQHHRTHDRIDVVQGQQRGTTPKIAPQCSGSSVNVYACPNPAMRSSTVEETESTTQDPDASKDGVRKNSWPFQNTLEFEYFDSDTDEDDEEDKDDDDDDEDDDDDDDDDEEKPIQYDKNGEPRFPGIGDVYQSGFSAYDIDYFDSETFLTKNMSFEHGDGKAMMQQLLRDIVSKHKSSAACADSIKLHGYFIYDEEQHNSANSEHPTKIIAIGLLRHGRGELSIHLWPHQRKATADFSINNSGRKIQNDPHHGNDTDSDEEDEDVDIEMLMACVESIGVLLYPNPEDVITPNGIIGHPGNVDHATKLQPFDSYTKYQRDPYRFRWYLSKGRGFPVVDENEHDIFYELASIVGWKRRSVHVQSEFQSIDIIAGEDDVLTIGAMQAYMDTTNPKLHEVREYMETHPQFFQQDRLLHMDGVMQSTLEGLAVYHEALVQPAMFAHPHPKRVAIIGGGECATLRETLKHNTVEKVFMIEIDPMIVAVSKQYLPEWNDCSMFEHSARYCMDDPRVEMHYLDALQWFIDRFSAEAKNANNPLYGTEEPFDVVILDALDPQNAVDFVKAIYGEGSFMDSLYNSLTENGVMVTQVGQAVSMHDTAETYPGHYDNQRAEYESALKNQGFEVVMHYEEMRGGFNDIWSFYAAFKHDSIRRRWFRNEAQIDLDIHKRAVRRREPNPSDALDECEQDNLFQWFDGTTMVTYQYPSKDSQVVYCKRDPQPYGCITDINNRNHYTPYVDNGRSASGQRIHRPFYEPLGFDPDIPNYTVDKFMVSKSGDNSKLVSRVPIPENSYLMLEQTVHEVRVSPITSSLIDAMDNSINDDDGTILSTTINPAKEFISGHRDGLSTPRRRDIHSTYGIDSGLLSFMQHGCNGNFNTATSQPSLTEQTVISDTDGSIPSISEDADDGPLLVRVRRSYQYADNDTAAVSLSSAAAAAAKELIFNPSFTRNSNIPEYAMSSRSIPKGDAIVTNSVPWYDPVGWNQHITTLRSQCL